MEATPKQFWYFLITGKHDDVTGLFGNFYSYGEHCGECLYHALNAARQNGFLSPDAIEADRLDHLEGFQLPSDCIEINSDVLMRPTLHSFEVDNEENQFIPPTGIIKSSEDSEYDYDLIRESFVAYSKNENGIFEFELVSNKDNLLDTFFKAIDFLPTIDGFWIYVWNHWDDQNTELWAGKNLADKESIATFLKSNILSTLENGYVDCVVHSLIGETNLTLDEHKKILLHTKDEKVFNEFVYKMMDLGYSQTHDLYNLEIGYHHWHYRTQGSLDRNSFINLLRKEKFDLLDSRE